MEKSQSGDDSGERMMTLQRKNQEFEKKRREYLELRKKRWEERDNEELTLLFNESRSLLEKEAKEIDNMGDGIDLKHINDLFETFRKKKDTQSYNDLVKAIGKNKIVVRYIGPGGESASYYFNRHNMEKMKYIALGLWNERSMINDGSIVDYGNNLIFGEVSGVQIKFAPSYIPKKVHKKQENARGKKGKVARGKKGKVAGRIRVPAHGSFSEDDEYF